MLRACENVRCIPQDTYSLGLRLTDLHALLVGRGPPRGPPLAGPETGEACAAPRHVSRPGSTRARQIITAVALLAEGVQHQFGPQMQQFDEVVLPNRVQD